jgi:predicted DNA-binding ribbon-helix-helix protein
VCKPQFVPAEHCRQHRAAMHLYSLMLNAYGPALSDVCLGPFVLSLEQGAGCRDLVRYALVHRLGSSQGETGRVAGAVQVVPTRYLTHRSIEVGAPAAPERSSKRCKPRMPMVNTNLERWLGTHLAFEHSS